MEEQNLAIRVNGLHKSYQKLHVLKGVDFDVASGSIFALLGSNGAGKDHDREDPRHPAQAG
jgi:ABC-2 type transport system ATP-binding protein